MRRAAVARAAGALLLAFGAAACKPSSLTPLGIDWRETGSAAQGASGLWSGTTSTGLGVAFQVGDDKVVNFTLSHGATGCAQEFTADDSAPIDANGAFSLEITYDQGRFVANGRFTSATTCSGSYAFEFFSVAGGSCPSSGSGTFVANKAP
jgi:hypothetical protein